MDRRKEPRPDSIWDYKTLSPHKVKKALALLREDTKNGPVLNIDARFEHHYLSLTIERRPKDLTEEEFEAAKKFMEDGDLKKLTESLGITDTRATRIVTKAVMATARNEDDDG